MRFGDKPLNQMSADEMREACDFLRTEREALRNEAIKDKAVRESKGMGEPRPKRERKIKGPNEADVLAAEMLRLLRGE